MTWRDVVRGVIAMIENKSINAQSMNKRDPIDVARYEGMRLAYQWISDELKYLVDRPPHEALREVRKWIATAARSA